MVPEFLTLDAPKALSGAFEFSADVNRNHENCLSLKSATVDEQYLAWLLTQATLSAMTLWHQSMLE